MAILETKKGVGCTKS